MSDLTSALGSLEYDPAPESASIAKLRETYGLFIDGEFRDPVLGGYFVTVNPASEEPLANVAQASSEDVDLAVAAARRAYETAWKKTTGAERAKYLFRIARLIQERARELAVVETLDNGKAIRESRDVDIPLAAAHFFYYAGWADKLDYAGFGPKPQPLGVAGQIIPWNFPLLMAAWKLAPALAAGNTCVLKPAETTPLSALILAEILQQAELPAGVVNIITGDGSTGAALVDHPGVDKIAFTGSTEVGRLIQQRVAFESQAPDARAWRQGREHRVRGRASRRDDRRHHRRDLLQSRPCLLCGLATSRPGVGRRRGGATAHSPRRSAARRRSARQEHRRRSDQLCSTARAHQ